MADYHEMLQLLEINTKVSNLAVFVNGLATSLTSLKTQVDAIVAQLKIVITKEDTIMADLSALTAQVQANTDTEQSAIVLLNQLADLIKANATDPAALAGLSDQLKASATSLAQAIVANTPAAAPPLTKKKP